nr:nucleotidyltransferase family protein [Actinospica robiniae]
MALDEQLRVLQPVLERNRTLVEVAQRSVGLGLPDWYLAAGCVCQTVWNVATGQAADRGIKDYDLVYFDSADLSWEAEDAAIQAGMRVFGDLPVVVEIRNEARVHLWYEEKFGVPCVPYDSTEAAIDTFPATACCVGVRIEDDGRWSMYAPYGLSDVFNLVIRPNPVQVTREVYAAKADRWRRQWPELTVTAWSPNTPGLATS